MLSYKINSTIVQNSDMKSTGIATFEFCKGIKFDSGRGVESWKLDSSGKERSNINCSQYLLFLQGDFCILWNQHVKTIRILKQMF